MKINHASPVPIYEQLATQIITQIGSLQLKPGESLPSVRRLAKQTGVAINTIAKAYSELERQGYIKVYGNKGAFVLEQSGLDKENPLYEDVRVIIDKLIQKGEQPHIIRRTVDEILTKYQNR